jgi:hypothetical protein
MLSKSDNEQIFRPEIIAHHLQSAGRFAESIKYWQQAGEEAVLRGPNREAIQHFGRAGG